MAGCNFLPLVCISLESHLTCYKKDLLGSFNMKRLFQRCFIAVAILFLATSCLDIQESVFMRDNGSGKFALTVNLENMESLLKMVQKLSGDADAGNDILADTEVDFEKLKKKLERQPGISHVTRISENNNKLLGISFDFDNVKSLNKALKELNDSKNEHEAPKDYFAYQKGKLTRMNTLGITDKVENKIKAETDIDLSVNGMMIGSLMKDMSYTTKYTFERPVKKASNPAARITNEGRTVTLTYHFFDKEPGATNLENSIDF